jgi:hypothetical protein
MEEEADDFVKNVEGSRPAGTVALHALSQREERRPQQQEFTKTGASFDRNRNKGRNEERKQRSPLSEHT